MERKNGDFGFERFRKIRKKTVVDPVTKVHKCVKTKGREGKFRYNPNDDYDDGELETRIKI